MTAGTWAKSKTIQSALRKKRAFSFLSLDNRDLREYPNYVTDGPQGLFFNTKTYELHHLHTRSNC